MLAKPTAESVRIVWFILLDFGYRIYLAAVRGLNRFINISVSFFGINYIAIFIFTAATM